MTKIITVLLKILNTLNKFSWKWICILTRMISPEEINKINSKPDDIRYRQFAVDDPAFISPTPFKELEKLDYKQIIKEHNIKPVKRRNGKKITVNVCCPHCNAPKEYLYDNTGNQIQFECKVCNHLFWPSAYKEKSDINLKCPHCFFKLTLYHQRDNFNVYKCPNYNCSFYLKNKNSLNAIDKEKFKKNPTLFKMHYIYRTFNIDTPTLTKDFREFLRTPVDLNKIYYSKHIVGLCLTIHVNYGLSYRATAAMIYDLYGIEICHQTVKNYCNAVSSIVHPVLEFYDYDLSDSIAGDETYIKIMGKQHFVFFMCDSVNNIITSYRVFDKRDAISAIKAVYSTLAKYDTVPKNLKMITDGNPIYPVAHQYWSGYGYNFDLIQVIGLKNKDPISGQYRSYKQIIERHNRTFKFYYRPTNGLSSLFDANTYMILFSTCFNFLRPHQALGYKVPQHVEEIANKPHMPAKWLELIDMGYRYTALYH